MTSVGERVSLKVVNPGQVGEHHADLTLLAAQRRQRGRAFADPLGDDRRQVGSKRRIEPPDLPRGLRQERQLLVRAPSRRRSESTGSVDSPRASADTTDVTAPAYQRSTRASVASRYRPPNAAVSDRPRWYSRRAPNAIAANAASSRTCHSHQLACQFRLSDTAIIASASSTNADGHAQRDGAPRRR